MPTSEHSAPYPWIAQLQGGTTELNIEHEEIGVNGASALADALSTYITLTTLGMSLQNW